MPKVTMPRIAQAQAKRVLSLMGPYSINKFIEAIDNGQIDGADYNSISVHSELYDSTKPENVEIFRGCFVGWAGFLENIAYDKIWDQLGDKFNKPDTSDLESFVFDIRRGATPATSPYSAELKRIVVRFQEKQAKQKEVSA